MTETLYPPPPAGGPPLAGQRLVRRPDEKVLAGVCAAFARATDTDPLLWRISIAVLSLFGGTGIALYALGWLLVPAAGQRLSAVERALRRPSANIGTVVLLGIGAVILFDVVGPGAGALVVLGIVGYLVLRERREDGGDAAPSAYGAPLVVHGPDPAPGPGSRVDADPVPVGPLEPYDSGLTAPLGYGTGSYDTSPFAAWDAGPPAPPPQRRRSQLGPLTLSAAAMLAGALLTLRAAGIEEITVARILAAVLVVLGGGMVLGAWFGRARWLLLPSAVVAMALVPAALVQAAPGPYGAGIGERTWVAAADGDRSFELGAGEARLDLTRLDPQALDGRPFEVALGVGELVVLVPEDLRVRVDADLRVGDIVVPDPDGGTMSLTSDSGGAQEQFVVGDDEDPVVELDLEVAAGVIEVERVAS